MWRTRVRTVAQESASLPAFVPWCSSCNSLILRNGEVTWRSELLQRLQEVRGNCKTRNRLNVLSDPACLIASRQRYRSEQALHRLFSTDKILHRYYGTSLYHYMVAEQHSVSK